MACNLVLLHKVELFKDVFMFFQGLDGLIRDVSTLVEGKGFESTAIVDHLNEGIFLEIALLKLEANEAFGRVGLG